MSLHLGDCKFDAQSNDIRYDDHGEHFPQTVEEQLEESGVCQAADSIEMLITYVVYPEKKCRNQSKYHDDHGSLQIDGIPDMSSAGSGRIRHEKKRLETGENGGEFFQLKLIRFFHHQFDSVAQDFLNRRLRGTDKFT